MVVEEAEASPSFRNHMKTQHYRFEQCCKKATHFSPILQNLFILAANSYRMEPVAPAALKKSLRCIRTAFFVAESALRAMVFMAI